jgi:hypothetical protein
MKPILLPTIIYLLLATNVFSQTCLSNIPTTTAVERFIVNEDETVLDTETDLVWKRCAEGQVFDSLTTACTFDHLSYDWQQGLSAARESSFIGKTDWRLPNVKELDSIVARHCVYPAIELVPFPNTPGVLFLSNTPYSRATGPELMMYVDFANGALDHGPKSSQNYAVRLVRSNSGG